MATVSEEQLREIEGLEELAKKPKDFELLAAYIPMLVADLREARSEAEGLSADLKETRGQLDRLKAALARSEKINTLLIKLLPEPTKESLRGVLKVTPKRTPP